MKGYKDNNIIYTTKGITMESKDTSDNQYIAKKYQVKTDKGHVLALPDTYIGDVSLNETKLWILSENDDAIIEKKIKFIPALLKLFDECIVNARDHSVRMEESIKNKIPNSIPVSFIDVSIQEDGTIVMINDGSGIDIVKHPVHNIWIPELIFGHLRSGTNYDEEEVKIIGGKNGFGVKLIFIWSTYGEVETIDNKRGLKYVQRFRNNLDIIEPPTITNTKSKPFTKITFRPDYKRLGIENLTPDMISLFKKRVYDIGAITDKKVKVKYNGSPIQSKNFKQYIEMYISDKSKIVYEESGDRWEYAVALSPKQEFVQVSFVNGICTTNGGKHVEYILNQILRKVLDFIEKKKKVKVSSNSIKEQLILFLRCDIENPSFDSQSKTCLTTKSSDFGSTATVSDKTIEKITKLGIIDVACKINEIKENKTAMKTDGEKSKNVRGIPKLVDANFAGTPKSGDCTLILCEGDSAKSGILSGLSTEDKNIIGVFPLKGKLLNVRGENIKKISENKEIVEIKKILGLKNGKEYKDFEDVSKNLRYGKILILTDSDVDGSHIKGLIVNLFHSEWASLLKIRGFISFMNTPILKGRKNNKEILFYNDGEYEKWKDENDPAGWKMKYYKGLGTSDGTEFKQYFKNKKVVDFFHSEICDDTIDKVFNKKRANNRKEWLSGYNRKNYLDTSNPQISYTEFIDRELIHFSKYDCDRSIPNMVDGLKTSQRKILYSAFKRNLTTEVKVAQFSGYVSEHSNYHHGEASLNGAIIGLAQNFTGSNNINLLVPNGTFGSRLSGGQDHASERYIYTLLSKITKFIFNQYDNNILEYLNDDGTIVEPVYYIPIIPMVLINGSKGIGTGFSTTILSYNPSEIIVYIRNKLRNMDCENNDKVFIPFYQGFKGTITPIQGNTQKFLFKGNHTIIGDDKVRVTELPVGFWTDNFKELLEELCESVDKEGKKISPIVKDYSDNSTDKIVDFTIIFYKEKLAELLSGSGDYGCTALEKVLKLYTTESSTNMHLFDSKEKLKKYETIPEIIEDFYSVRIDAYQKRKDYIIEKIKKETLLLKNKVKFIGGILEETIELRRKTNAEITQMLEEKGFDKINDDYSYLIDMSFKSLSNENMKKLKEEYENKINELELTTNTTVEQMWLNELDALEKEYNNFKNVEEENIVLTKTKTNSSSTSSKKKASSSKK